MDPHRLIDQIYENALDGRDWRPLLKRIAEFSGVATVSFASGNATQPFSLVCSGTDPDLLDEFARDWAFQDPAILGLMGMRAGEVSTLDRVVDREAYGRSAVYNDFWKRSGQSPEHLRQKVVETEDEWFVYAYHADWKENEIHTDAWKSFRLFSPHIARAVQIRSRLKRAAMADIHAARPGVILVDRRGRVIDIDATAERLVARSSHLRILRGYLDARDPRLSMDILLRIDGALRRGRSTGVAGGTLAIADPIPLEMEILPLPSCSDLSAFDMMLGARAEAMIILSRPGTDLSRLGHRLGRDHGLSPAEIRVALETLEGGGRKAIAQRIGIAETTVRSHLSSIFDKLDVHRQADLVALLSRLNTQDGDMD